MRGNGAREHVPDAITATFRDHYTRTFGEHGASPKGVDWGKEPEVMLRYDNMLALAANDPAPPQRLRTILDVGCGYGGLLERLRAQQLGLQYTGIDVVGAMIDHAHATTSGAEFLVQDVFAVHDRQFDYVVCSGILTQKLTASIRDMDQYANRLVRKMYELCERGVAFNVMTNKVNFMAENLYYRSPIELLSYVMTELTTKVRLDHAYPIYEYTLYLYRE